MKNYSLLLIASLAVLTASASAAQGQPASDLIVLPTYVVEAPRYLPIERHIDASLNELRQQAHARLAIAPEFSTLKVQVARSPGPGFTAQSGKTVRLAKS